MAALVDLRDLDAVSIEQLAKITLPAAMAHAPGWLTDLEAAREEIAEAREAEKVARVVVEGGQPIGWISAAPAWGRIWEIHPLIVAIDRQRRGHGRTLVRAIERIAAEAGALTMTLSTSDMTNATSLSAADLYSDLPGKLAGFAAHRDHSVSFWLRAGYTITGVIPDAEGPGMPSIHLARRL